MPKDNTVVGLDIGSQKIRVVVATLEEDGRTNPLPNVVGVGVAPSSGLRKGAIVDVNETIASITAALEDAERMSGVPIHHATIGVGGAHLGAQVSRGVIAIPTGSEITDSDVDRVVEAAQAVSIPSNRQILRVTPQAFSVDEQRDIRNPVGMMGVRLEVDAQIVTGLAPALKNLENAIHQSGVDVDDFVPAPLAVAEAVANKRQRELGVVTIDIGATSTGVTVYEEGILLGMTVLPVGGASVTNDIAIGLRTGIDTAERLKIEYGTCSPDDVSDRESIELAAISKTDSHAVSKKMLAEIVQARYQEIFSMISDFLKTLDRDGQLPAGAIITGGGAKIPELLELSRESLGLPTQIGFPTEVDGVVDRIDDPIYATAIGLVLHGMKGPSRGYSFSGVGNLFGGVKDFFRRLLP